MHYFRHLVADLQKKGHAVLFTARRKEVIVDLLEHYCLPYKIIGNSNKGLFSKILGLLGATVRLLFTSLRFKPDMLMNASPSSAFVAWLLRKPHISLEDTFNMEQVRLYLPFTTVVLTGDHPDRPLGKKEIEYPGYQKLLYLHPQRYQPDQGVFQSLGLEFGEAYVVLRFIAWSASHDVGHKGLSLANKIELVESLQQYAHIFISAEAGLEPELQKYRLKIPPHKMHDALYFARLYVGEGATMAAESAILGTPSIFIHNTKLGYISDLVSHALVHQFSESDADQRLAIQKAIEIAKDDSTKEKAAAQREKMLSDKIDVTAFLIWLVESYPHSLEQLRQPNFSFDSFR